MQTFLPYDSYQETARCLDYRRLGKQRVETLQILNALNGQSRGWVNHPATKMWRGHRVHLISYGIAICDEWIRRGYKDTCGQKILGHLDAAYAAQEYDIPPWLGYEPLHSSHRSNLLRKDSAYYGQFGWRERDDMPYVWVESDGWVWTDKSGRVGSVGTAVRPKSELDLLYTADRA
jgi:hypothetical protein